MTIYIKPASNEQVQALRNDQGMGMLNAGREARLINLQEACSRARTPQDMAQILIELIHLLRLTQ
jgi:hypothetical protein